MASVLLVDGHADETQMYRDCLEAAGLGFSIQICEPEDACDCAAATPPDVVVTDLVLPFSDGVQLIRGLRRNSRTESVGIVVITARTEPSDFDRALEAGCDFFLRKPCPPEVLLAEIKRAVALTRRRQFERRTDPAQSG